jgi:predicted site-specific integrase-resolvase
MPPVEPPEDPLLSLSEVAERFGVTPKTVWRWKNAGKLRAVTTPSGVAKYRQSDVDVFLIPADDEQATA